MYTNLTKILVSVIVGLLIHRTATAQHQELDEQPNLYKGKQTASTDTSSLLHAFKTGKFNGHFRYFFMATDNAPGLTDYYANAAGGGLRFETARFHGFQMAVSGFYIFNIGSSDFTKADTATGRYNRYETALFDIEDPTNKKDIDRLEEFYLRYNYHHAHLTLGRQLVNTPLINLQDGRMRATGVEGAWLEMGQINSTRIEGGWLYAVSPRSTVKWYNAGQSIGIYPGGVNPDGTASSYAHHIKSNGIAVTGITTIIKKQLTLQVWNLWAENVFNTTLVQAEWRWPLSNGSSFFSALQFIRQTAVATGGNADPAKTYFAKGQQSFSMGGRAGWKNKYWEATLNTNRITAHGRYLLPREWGREPFFTYLPRERNEGTGDVYALMAKLDYQFPSTGLKSSLAAGYYHLPDVKNHRLNKYGLVAYTQVNADIRYAMGGLLKGMEAQLLIVGKISNGETYHNKNYEFNKVNMVQYNLVVNYHF